MTGPMCGAAGILRPGGPVAVPFRSCCVSAVLRAAAAEQAAVVGAADPDLATVCLAAPDPVAVCVAEAGTAAAGSPSGDVQLLLLTEPLAVGEP